MHFSVVISWEVSKRTKSGYPSFEPTQPANLYCLMLARFEAAGVTELVSEVPVAEPVSVPEVVCDSIELSKVDVPKSVEVPVSILSHDDQDEWS